jgi:Ca2+-binding EF-hand superfamily protein
MTSITSSVSSAWSSANMQRAQQRPGPSPERLLAKMDTDGSGGVNATELQGLLDDVSKKTGVGSQASAAGLVQQYDSDGDGSLNADELGKTMQSVLPPPPSTMAFAQSRSDSSTGATGQAGDDLFGKVDTDGDGGVSLTELQALLEKMSGGTAGKTGVISGELFSQLDADGDGSLSEAEFDAGRPSGEAGGGVVAGMPPPPPGGPGGAPASSSTTYDPLDTNEDGVVSAAEQAAGATQADAITALFKTIDTDGDSSISSAQAQSFISQLTSQFASATGSTESASRSESSGSGQNTDLVKLAQLARSHYEAAAGSWSRSTSGASLSALA